MHLVHPLATSIQLIILLACQVLKESLHQKHFICFSPVSSLYFSILSSSQILFSECMETAVVVDALEMIDHDEEVALE